ncbi:metal-dependent hydrolase [Metabacillus malikii]|uniref:Inner membrane protein n=1 Tax=Metabacillus malikii TaxID=1504265 RepID=A0ABT9Z9Z0_9BACI|nr:metal-dependent hydrolase [Metabacillus malikii]MDQ0228840.1 inner membrane protein [Metabacillus malikii]
MDTSTHIIMGFGLAGLAYIDPAVASNPELAQTIMFATILGSNAPDFDYAVKLVKGNGMYIEHHRGLSHSIPALFIWTAFISCLCFLFGGGSSFSPIFYWTFIAVVLHVGFDLLNVYGTQAGRPLTKRWLSLNTLPLFDPIIFVIHLVCFILWSFNYPPGTVFTFAYLIISIYIIIRLIVHYLKRQFILKKISLLNCTVTLVPKMNLNSWNVVVESEADYRVGIISGLQVNWLYNYKKQDMKCEFISASRNDKNVLHFLKNSKHTYAISYPTITGTEVRWIDLRFHTNNHFPYMAIVKFNKEGKISSSYTGWIHHTRQIESKLSKNQSVYL